MSATARYAGCAYFTLVMRGDEYVPAACALGESLANSGTRVSNRYCMVTDDVSAAGRARLSRYWQLVDVEYLRKQRTPLLISNRMREIYGDWISVSFTKWRCLEVASKLTHVTRYIYLDADTIALQNFDKMFDETRDWPATVMTNMFPVFSTVSYHANRYHNGPLYQRVARFELGHATEDESNAPPWYLPVDVADLRRQYLDATRVEYRAKRHFLVNSSMVYFSLSATDSEAMFEFVRSSVRDNRRTWYANHRHVPHSGELRAQMDAVNRCAVSVFANGFDEQLLAETLLTFPGPLRLCHLRTFCNVNAGFWDSSKIKMQPWTMTWWGSNKPWNDNEPTPKYADVYLFRYFHERAVARGTGALVGNDASVG